MTANRLATAEKKCGIRLKPAFWLDSIGRMGIALMVGLCVLVLPSGCGEKKPGTNRLHARGTPFLTGVPVPNGFKFEKNWSRDLESGGTRVAEHIYSGSSDLFAVRDFYFEQMPLMGWNRTSSQNIEGKIQMRFEKKTEECSVEIEGGAFGRVKIQVIVKPFNRNATEPPRRPMP